MDMYQNWILTIEFIFFVSLCLIFDKTECFTTNTTSVVITTTTTTITTGTTTLASEFKLHDTSRIYILVGVILAGIPVLVLCLCLARSVVSYRREKKITDDYDMNFQHPPPSHPAPRPFLQRDNTIAGPFRNQAYDQDNEESDSRSSGVTPSFVSTRIVDIPGFGVPTQQRKYQYIP